MSSRVCPKCRLLVPANGWNAHQDAHRNQRPNPRHSPEYRRNRELAFRRDGYRCVVCGVSASALRDRGLSLEADHVNGDSFDHRVENLRSKCPDHNPRGGSLPGRGL